MKGGFNKLQLADEACVGLQGEALASGTVPYGNGHTQTPRNDPHTIKSNAVHLMEVPRVDVDALARVVLSTRIHISLFHDPHSERRVPAATVNHYCERAVMQKVDGGGVNLGRVVYNVKKLKRVGSRREGGRGGNG